MPVSSLLSHVQYTYGICMSSVAKAMAFVENNTYSKTKWSGVLHDMHRNIRCCTTYPYLEVSCFTLCLSLCPMCDDLGLQCLGKPHSWLHKGHIHRRYSAREISTYGSEHHMEFNVKSTHLHSFTPPIPADQLTIRALTPAVYLPLNTFIIWLYPGEHPLLKKQVLWLFERADILFSASSY